MIKNIVTNERLDAALQALINDSKFYYPTVKDFFSDMYITGCRTKELLFPELVSYDSGTVKLLTFKTGTVRSFDEGVLSVTLVEQAKTGVKAYGGLSVHQIMNEYKRHFGLVNLSCGGKMVELYSFRYNRARIEREVGKTDIEIMTYMGWNSLSVMNGYINNTLNQNK
jgi:hypothetical protein